MASIDDKIKELEDELDKTPRNKGTEHHIGKLKAKIAKLKEEGEVAKAKKSSFKGAGYQVKKAGDATIVLVGFPSVGKSTLLNRITNAESKIGAYEFTTLTVVPGVMEYRGAKIQVLDIPGIIEDAAIGKGRGREILATVRSADLVLIVTDVRRLEHIRIIKRELERVGMRLNQSVPDIEVIRKDRGGMTVKKTVNLTKIDEGMIKGILGEFSIHNGEILIKEDISVERLIDALSKNRAYVPMLVVINKIDTIGEKERDLLNISDEHVFVSADKDINIDELKERIFSKLGLMRIYMKKPGKEPDRDDPLIMHEGATVEDVCIKIHKEFAEKFLYAKIWGPSAKFGGQKVGNTHILKDEDAVELAFEK